SFGIFLAFIWQNPGLFSVQFSKYQASVPAGSRNSKASVPASSRKSPASVSAASAFPAGSRNRPAYVPAGRPFSTSWKNHAARPMTRPTSHYFQHFSRPGNYNQMYMDEGRWGTAVKPSTGPSQQPKGFKDPHFSKHVYKVVKALNGLHQAPRAWYARLSTFLLTHNYRRGTIDKTLFIKKDSRDIILVQVYVDDTIFGSTKKAWCEEFEVLMKGEFEMSVMGELTFFVGLQVKQKPDGIFISQDKYVQDMLKKFDTES
ncbi:uncharacterized mitochondrial protein-like protein, partial [Tanacetum coccineum]